MKGASVATWRPHPNVTDHDCAVLASDEDFANGDMIGLIEDFGYACYPAALNAASGNWERGGPRQDRVAARLWVERVAGLHPSRPEDRRPAFYYQQEPS